MTEQKVLLTQLEAAYVLEEAYRLKAHQIADFGIKHARLGQSIHWASHFELSYLDMSLQKKLKDALDYQHTSALDFYYWTDESKVLEVFYKHYVEQSN